MDIQLHRRLSEVPKANEHRFLIQAVTTAHVGPEFDRDLWNEMERNATVQHYRFAVGFTSGTTGTNTYPEIEKIQSTDTDLNQYGSQLDDNIRPGGLTGISGNFANNTSGFMNINNANTSNNNGKGGESGDLDSKYTELQAYIEVLQDSKVKFEEKIKACKTELAGPARKKGYQLWQVIAAVAFAFLFTKVVDRVMMNQTSSGYGY